jgi:Protein of unknown function (DUF1488)
MSQEFGCHMPLTRGTALVYDVTAMTFGFTMTDQRSRTVQCSISGAAMDELDDRSTGKGTLPKDRRAQFDSLRERIEAMASALFDHDISGRDTVQIFYHHAWSRKYRAMPIAATIATPSTPSIANSPRDTVLREAFGNKGLDGPS